MKNRPSEISLPISSTNYRKTLLDVVNYFETVFNKPIKPMTLRISKNNLRAPIGTHGNKKTRK